VETNDGPKNKFTVVAQSEESEEIKSETIEAPKKETPSPIDEVTELSKLRNLKVFLNKTVGRKWLLAYKNGDGIPMYIPNYDLSAEETVFLAELVKVLSFGRMSTEEADI
jgi:hypothetical protein